MTRNARTLRPARTARSVAIASMSLALVAGPVVATGTTGAADAASTRRATATSLQQATVTARRMAASTMKATVVARAPGVSPVTITESARATRQASSAASASARKTITVRAATTKQARKQAKKLARSAARKLATSRATIRAARAATNKATVAARAAARDEAVRKATAAATAKLRATNPGAKPVTDTTVTPVTGPCGGVLPAKATGGRYTTCSFDDSFAGAGLDPSKWTAWDAQKDPFIIGDECFKPENVSQAAGALQLTATKSAKTLACSKRQLDYQSGLVSTKGKFSQTYGRFEMRAKFPTDAGYVSGFWMLPENPFANGYSKYKYGEIDIVENWALHPELMWAHLHYAQTPGNVMGGTYCQIKQDGQFHTYAVDWAPTKMTFIYDDQPCWSTTWKPYYPYAPSGSASPAPFDQPFYMIINLSVGGSGSTKQQPLSKTPMGKSLQVDWVRAWK